MAKSQRRIRFPRASIIRPWVPSMLGLRSRAAPNIPPSAMQPRSMPRALWLARRESSRRSKARTRWPALIERAPKMPRESVVILNVSGRGDKDMETLAKFL